jgi:hypothetical protein
MAKVRVVNELRNRQLYRPSLALLQSVEDIQQMKPEYLRIPAACRFSGLSRSHLWAAMADGQLKYVHVKQPGASKGVRLIKFDSLMAYLQSFEQPRPAA